ncbi:MAG: Aromatic-ring-hydroxylating dioxygenase, alpha subunit-like protein [Frankiales bacterium]|nr:Aromatic-ring-hydroxylating dioxygenase, alpha subunit-like protein [Frankiales bacterium]
MTAVEDIADVRDGLPAGRDTVRSEIYSDPGIWSRERERIFEPGWNFLAHESEIPEPGDFVVRYILEDSIIVSRGRDGTIRAFLNVCRHRSMLLCRAEGGSARKFVCPYHGWSYDMDGRLSSLPLERPYFSTSGVDREELSLRPLPRLGVTEGFVFGSLASEGEPLEEYLGDFAWYLAIHTRRDPQGLEVLGPPQRWIVRNNWKIGAENFAGDSYHAQYTHRSVLEIGLHPNSPKDFQGRGKRDGINVLAGPGVMRLARQSAAERGYPPDMVDLFRSTLPAPQRDLLFGDEPRWPTGGHLFPNLSFLNAGAFVAERRLVPFLNVRLWRPLDAETIETWSWVLVEKSASPSFRRDSMRSYVLTFGTTGTEEQDDVENFTQMQRGLAGVRAKDVPQQLIMGRGLREEELAMPSFGGPGTAVATTYTDAGLRRFHQLWERAMAAPPSAAAVARPDDAGVPA